MHDVTEFHSTPSAPLWTRDLALAPGTSGAGSAYLDAVGSGSLVYVVLNAALNGAGSGVRYLVIDTTSLR